MKRNRWLAVGIVGVISILAACGSSTSNLPARSDIVVNGYTIKAGAILLRANLSGANLTDVNLGGANLGGANLSGADLQGADLQGADLRGADLTEANLTDANLSGADLRMADLTGIYWASSTRWPEGFTPPPSAG